MLLLLPWFVPPPVRDASSLFCSTAFSHDSQLLAIATEEDGIDVADAAHPEPQWDCEFGDIDR
jgi:hypothetical protein